LRKMAVGNETGQALHKNGLRLSIKQGAVQAGGYRELRLQNYREAVSFKSYYQDEGR